MDNIISKKDFSFTLIGPGYYKVCYKSPKTGKVWETYVNDMMIIDLTKNEEIPKRKHLERLKWLVKRK